jgi:hypothetical protein
VLKCIDGLFPNVQIYSISEKAKGKEMGRVIQKNDNLKDYYIPEA